MKHLTAIQIRCHNKLCQELYQITLSANPERHSLEIRFASCPHCRTAKDIAALRLYWSKSRCWSCHIPHELIREHAHGLCYACYRNSWKQINSVPKEMIDGILQK